MTVPAQIRADGIFLTLGADGDLFAVPVERVQEILDLQPVARLPHAPSALLGMIDVRGHGAPVADLRTLLGLMPGADDQNTRIVVLRLSSGLVVGLKADRVFEVAGLDGGEMERPTRAGHDWGSDALAGIGRREGAFVTILDVDRLLGAQVAAFATTA